VLQLYTTAAVLAMDHLPSAVHECALAVTLRSFTTRTSPCTVVLAIAQSAAAAHHGQCARIACEANHDAATQQFLPVAQQPQRSSGSVNFKRVALLACA
jgi:hypothetical protein